MAKEKEHESSGSHVTTDHDEIRKWVEERGGKPSQVRGTGEKEDPGLLRINYPGVGAEDRLEDISWDEFFQKFDEKNLAFLYQDKKADGEQSRFSKFVNRKNEGTRDRDKGQKKNK